MLNFTQLFGAAAAGGAGAVLGPMVSVNCFSSRTWTAPQDGILIIRALGAGGGGASVGTGGYSGSWGAKIVRVAKGASVVVTIGAGGGGGAASSSTADAKPGGAGGNTTVVVGGITYTANGGPGGIAVPTAAPPNGPSPSSNWDIGINSVIPGWSSTAGHGTGGAGVNILAGVTNVTTSASSNGSGGGGTGGPSSGGTGGGANGTQNFLGFSDPIWVDASPGGSAEWGISFYGGAGATINTRAGNGGGGCGGSINNSAYKNGGNGGGGACQADGGGAGGRGGGGGSVPAYGFGGISEGAPGGKGGAGYCHLKFFADMGV